MPPSCLEGATIFFIGFSEIGRYWTWLRDDLRCTPELRPSCLQTEEQLARKPRKACLPTNLSVEHMAGHCHNAGYQSIFAAKAARHFKVPLRVHDLWRLRELRDGLCRQRVYGEVGGINASCTARDASRHFKISYRWKTFQTDKYDALDRLRVLKASARGRVFVVLEGGGPHHFTKFKEHMESRQPHATSTIFTSANDSWNWPQHWIDDYVAGTKRLLRLHAQASAPSSNTCVLWKAMHVGPRDTNTDGMHHPSVVNGANQWLNRLAISAVQDISGVAGVLDLTEHTQTRIPGKKFGGAHAAATAEGDPYHGYDKAWLAPLLLQRMCELCVPIFAKAPN